MSEPAREGRVLARIEAEFRAADPGLTALFDSFARRSPAPAAPRQGSAGRGDGRKLTNRILALLLVPLIAMTVLAMVSGSRKAATGPRPCPPPAAVGRPLSAGALGCPAARQPRWPAPVPVPVWAPARSRRAS
jgi:hypothetical protein